MRELTTRIEINGTPEHVWAVLTDFQSYPDWNPVMTSARGTASQGVELTIHMELPDGRAMTFSPEVLVAVPNRELRWAGKLWLSVLFRGEHYFRIESLENGRSVLTHGERFTGILVPIMGLTRLFSSTLRAFELMNDALKARVEQQSA